MLSANDPVPARPRRLLLAGGSGSGKTTLAQRIAAQTGIPHSEIDGLFHGPNWTPRPEFEGDVARLVAADSWVTEWQYDSARPVLAARAELLVWLDYSFVRVTLPRVVTRTVRRRWRRQVLWNGNQEGPLWRFFVDREHIIRWSIITRNKFRELVPPLESQYPQLVVVRLRSSREADTWLRNLRY